MAKGAALSEQIEGRIARANRDVERLFEARRVLQQRLAEAEERERNDALSNERQAAEKEATAVVADISKKYPKLAGEIVVMLQRLDAAETAVEQVNERLAAAGRADERLAPVEQRVFPKKNSNSPHLRFWSLKTEISLPFVPGFAEGWGRHVSGFSGLMDREQEAA